jgi:hypothetical protein
MDFRENDTAGEISFSISSWGGRGLDKGSMKGNRALTVNRWAAVQLDQTQVCRGGSVKQPACVGIAGSRR